MRLLVGVLILLVAIAGFTTFIYYQTSEIAGDLTASLSRLQEEVERENWEAASAEVSRLKKEWERADRWWTPFMDHREIDVLDQTIVRVARLVAIEQKEDALVEVIVATSMVQRLRDREGPSLRNVF